jgi:hypothetical protein
MAMREDFCAFILSHGRPDRVHTYKTLLKAGYTGKIYIVIDDEDKTSDQYRAIFGDKVLQFCKSKYAAKLDEGDNTGKRTSTIYARAAMFDLAPKLGCKYFIQLDDDYTNFRLRFDAKNKLGSFACPLDQTLEILLEFYLKTNAVSVAMSQGADLSLAPALRRKCMNSFICSTDRPWVMTGRMNEDVSTYVNEGRRGDLFFTVMQAQLNQKQTQTNAGGMSELYLDSGTYVKSFYSVMYAPSCVKVAVLKAFNQSGRIHHKIDWAKTAPKIIRQEFKRKASQ